MSPVVLRYDDPGAYRAPDVVFLHGRGGSERDAGPFVPAFRHATLRAYRGPIAQGGGFAWFRHHAIGVADEASLQDEVARVRGWIDADTRWGRPWLCGFSNGAAMAASLLLDDPAAFAGLVMIAGCFAVDALPSDRLAGLPVLFCRGRHDVVIPAPRFAASLAYLGKASGADLTELDYEGGHDAPAVLPAAIAAWFSRYAGPTSGGAPSRTARPR